MKEKKTTLSEKDIEVFVDNLVDNWPSGYVARKQTGPFTGDAVSSGSVSNREVDFPCPGRILIGKRIAYPTRLFAEWLAKEFLKPASHNAARNEPHKHKKNVWR